MEQQKKTMKAIVLEGQEKLVVKDVEIPVPKDGEVLVKMEASPINPSDIAFMKGVYGTKKPIPSIPGFEGSGTVVKSGGGMLGWYVEGKRVAVSSGQGYSGCYAEYCVAKAATCMPIPDEVSFDTASSSFVNPLTVIAMLDITQAHKCKAVISTAAASQVGRMIIRHFQKNGIQVINVIRRQEQVDILKKCGADEKYILNQNDQDFQQKLKDLAKQLNATVAFDAVSGELAGQVINNMPAKSTIYIYGNLSMKKACEIDTGSLIFKDSQIKGFFLQHWIKDKNMINQAMLMNKLKGLLNTELNTQIAKSFTLDQINEALDHYKKNMSGGKVLIKPNLQQQQQQQQQ